MWDYLSDQEAVDIVSACMPPITPATTTTYYEWWGSWYTYLAYGEFSGAQSKQEALQQAAAGRIVQRALEIAAEESGMSPAQLRALPVGGARRSRHDDTTAVVMYF